jgi:DNA-binding SARP family transcriptional activator
VRLQNVAAAPNEDEGSPPDGEGAGVRLELLGGFSLAGDGVAVDLPLSAQRLVAFLALQDRPLLRLYVAGILWPDANEKRSYANLRSALWRLRKVGHEIVEARSANLRLSPTVDVDARRALAVAHSLLRGDWNASNDGTALLAADLLPDWYDDWVVDERDRLHQLRVHALEVLARRLADGGSFGLAAEAGLAALQSNPLRESANRTLIEVFLAEGNPTEAVRHYRSYRSLLARELGLAPSERIRSLLPDLAG